MKRTSKGERLGWAVLKKKASSDHSSGKTVTYFLNSSKSHTSLMVKELSFTYDSKPDYRSGGFNVLPFESSKHGYLLFQVTRVNDERPKKHIKANKEKDPIIP